MDAAVLHRVVLIVLMGLPGSGKTTLARRLAAESGRGVVVTVVSFDDFYQREYGLAALRDQLDDAQAGEVVVVDDNMYYQSMRKQVWRMARHKGAAYMQVFVDTPLAECVVRNAARTGEARMKDGVIEHMHERLERPNAAKRQWDDAVIVTEGARELSVRPLLDEIEARARVYAKKQQQTDSVNEESPNRKDACDSDDLQMRREISRRVAMAENKPAVAKELNNVRKAALKSGKGFDEFLRRLGRRKEARVELVDRLNRLDEHRRAFLALMGCVKRIMGAQTVPRDIRKMLFDLIAHRWPWTSVPGLELCDSVHLVRPVEFQVSAGVFVVDSIWTAYYSHCNSAQCQDCHSNNARTVSLKFRFTEAALAVRLWRMEQVLCRALTPEAEAKFRSMVQHRRSDGGFQLQLKIRTYAHMPIEFADGTTLAEEIPRKWGQCVRVGPLCGFDEIKLNEPLDGRVLLAIVGVAKDGDYKRMSAKISNA